jgi:hypothetical protein
MTYYTSERAGEAVAELDTRVILYNKRTESRDCVNSTEGRVS